MLSTSKGHHQIVHCRVRLDRNVVAVEEAVVVDGPEMLGMLEIVPIELDRCQVGVWMQRDCPAK